jgi:hypothetical protein
MAVGLDMRFLGRKWQKKNRDKIKGNKIKDFRSTPLTQGRAVAAARFGFNAGL